MRYMKQRALLHLHEVFSVYYSESDFMLSLKRSKKSSFHSALKQRISDIIWLLAKAPVSCSNFVVRRSSMPVLALCANCQFGNKQPIKNVAIQQMWEFGHASFDLQVSWSWWSANHSKTFVSGGKKDSNRIETFLFNKCDALLSFFIFLYALHICGWHTFPTHTQTHILHIFHCLLSYLFFCYSPWYL